jgi:hypothetical protein
LPALKVGILWGYLAAINFGCEADPERRHNRQNRIVRVKLPLRINDAARPRNVVPNLGRIGRPTLSYHRIECGLPIRCLLRSTT